MSPPDEIRFLVALKGGKAPKCQHATPEAALAEARRLAKLHGRPARILMQVGAVFPMGGAAEDGVNAAKGSLFRNFLSGAAIFSEEVEGKQSIPGALWLHKGVDALVRAARIR